MSPDRLSEEGLEESEEFEVPFSITFLLFVFLTFPLVIHFNGHFYTYGTIARIF